MENEKGRRGQSRNVENAASKSATPASSIGQWRCTKLEKKTKRKEEKRKEEAEPGYAETVTAAVDLASSVSIRHRVS